jgi:hypothetical protein
MFRIDGRAREDGRRIWLVYDAGRLEGTAVDALEAEAGLRDFFPVGPVGGPYTNRTAEHLVSPLSVLRLAVETVFVEGAAVSGDPPVRMALPKGAIG